MGTHDERLEGFPGEPATVAARPGGRRPEAVTEPADEDAVAMFRAATAADRYVVGALIGQGGMGEVHGAADRATGRTVAVKTMTADQVDSLALRRFAREARIQAQLEHPSIVPVYDVGIDADGALFFTMKRIRGESLSHVLDGLRRGDDETVARYSRRRVLAVLSSVALTVEYAHQRGVLHRDLKPSNVMLGEFGEVYVLDWGLADVRDGERLEPVGAAPPIAAARPVVDSSVRPDTHSGQLLGTPGYAAPEQIERGSEALDERADVYALGAMLYEVLTDGRLHLGTALVDVLGSTLALDGARPAARAADVPPELDALCRRATRRDPADRLATAGAFARAIDAYLDGDRDLAERRRLADTRADAAAAVLAGPARDLAARAGALRDVTAALGLDPGHRRARATLVRLLTEPGPGAEDAAAAADHDRAVARFRHAARNAILALSTYALYVPLVWWMGVRRWWMLGTMAAEIVLVIAATCYYYRRPPPGLRLPTAHLLASLAALATGVFVAGPLVLLPAVVIATGVAYLGAFPDRAGLTTGLLLAVVLVPFGLQMAGVVPATYRFVDGTVVILPGMLYFPPLATQVFLVCTHTVVLAGALTFTWRLRLVARTAERRLRVQAWQLAQIVGTPTPPDPLEEDHDLTQPMRPSRR